MLPDMLMDADTRRLAQAVDAYDKVGGNIIVVEPVPDGRDPQVRHRQPWTAATAG